MNDKVRESIKTICILVAITIICVALLAILNDVLYVAPDMDSFDRTAKSKSGYTLVEQNVKMTNGIVKMVAEGEMLNGEAVVGLYVEGKGSSPAGSFTLVVIIHKATGEILGVRKLVDGGDVGYEYLDDNLRSLMGTVIDGSTVFDSDNFVVQAGATYSTKACRNAMQAVAEYYYINYLQGGQE
ncbi:MAG: hypothetical protein PHW00_04080 [Clostridia bacterium]|nr:hypothetical protein [Clostridia bacterium]